MSDPTPPLPVARPARRGAVPPRVVRAGLLAVAAVLAGVFAAAAYIRPYGPDGEPRRMGTHAQLGLAPCNFVALTGRPCPTCGMTTSFALLVRGDVSASLRANWVGTLLAATWAGLLVWAVAGAARGRALGVPPGRGELAVTAAVGVFLAMMLGRWGVVLWRG